jgi:hypothetical protein
MTVANVAGWASRMTVATTSPEGAGRLTVADLAREAVD